MRHQPVIAIPVAVLVLCVGALGAASVTTSADAALRVSARNADLVGQATPQADDPWIHIEVRESGADAANVFVNLPLSLVNLALDMAPDEILADGKLHLRHSHVTVPEMRSIWKQLRAAGDAEFLSVEKQDETVRVARNGERLRIRVTHKEPRREEVRIDVPVRLVDALLSGSGDQLNVRGALEQLATLRGEILSVHDGDGRVRIWIDERKGTRL